MSGYSVQVNTGIGTGQYNIHTWLQINKPDGTSEAYGFYPAQSDVGNIIYGPGDVRAEPPGASPTASSGPMPISESQYNLLREYIQRSDIAPPNYSIPLGSQCTNWALMALADVGIIPRVLGPDGGWGPLQTLIWNPLWQQVAWFYRDIFNGAKNWRWPSDPIVVDLDGDGLETVGLASSIYFDHDGDGVLTKTGWSGKDDALLVWDRNANGRVDTGAELFGDFTPLPNGTLAPNGFAALAALDANGDGVLDASDPAFAELKLWRDASQDGESQGGEFISLVDAGIVSLNLAHTLKNQGLANGNTLSREGSFTRADGSIGGMGEFRLATNTFDTRFAEQIEVPEALETLPNMSGAGSVRELQQAAAQSDAVVGLLAQFQSAATRVEQKALLDQLITAWADTSGMAKSLEERTGGRYRVQHDVFGNDWRSSNIDAAAFAASTSVPGSAALMTDAGAPYLTERYRNLISEWSRKLHVLEAFNGQYFFNLPDTRSQTSGANWGLAISAGASGSGVTPIETLPMLRVSFSQPQLDLLQQAYDSLRESVYASLVMQTRLRPYLDQIELVIDDQGIRLDASALNQMLADKRSVDAENHLADLLDLDRYAGDYLSRTNWSGLADFDSLVETLPQAAGVTALLDEFKVKRLTSGDDNASLTNDAEIVLAGVGNDTLYANGGNDRLFGQAGEDQLYGGYGDDLLSGGAGNDSLYGEAGADTYVFGRGSGNDAIVDIVEGGVQRDGVRFLGLIPADIRVTADHANNLTFTIEDTGETLRVPIEGYWWGRNGVGQYVFDDGTVWSHDDALRATVATTTANDDVVHGSSAGDTISGQGGNDTLIGNAGDDVIDGGAGNDASIGSTGWNAVYDNGQWRVERGVTSVVSANGNDTYLFGRGDGQDTVIDADHTAGNSDTLRFKEGVTLADLRLVRSGTDLVLALRGSSDQVTLARYFDEDWRGGNGAHLIERIAFSDGTVLSFADVQAILFAGSDGAESIIGSRAADVLTGRGGNDVLDGRTGDDVLEGGEGDDVALGGAGLDTLDGGAGNDVLRGGGAIGWNGEFYDWNGGGDVYRFGRGDGNDTIVEDSWQTDTDRVALKSGVTASDVRLERVRTPNGWLTSDDLRLTVRDTGETLTVRNHFDASNRHAAEEVGFADGTVWDLETIKSRSLIGEGSDDRLRGFDGRDDAIYGGAGNDELDGLTGDDVLTGGAGDDLLRGGAGSDTYRFGPGQDQDAIDEGYVAGRDAVDLTPDVTPDDVTVRWTLRGDMAVMLPDGSRLVVSGQAATWSDEVGIEQLRFADGTVWDRAELASRALAATAGDDAIVGGWQDDTLDGGMGNDRFQNLGGYDTYRFGIGDGQDIVEATYGRIAFKSGIGQNDVAFSRDGNDLIATVVGSGDSVRLKNWLGSWQRIDRFDFDNGAQLTEAEILARLNVAEGSEILTGSPGDDVLVGTAKHSTMYGRDGNDTLTGGAGTDGLLGEAGNDALHGGADEDTLHGGTGDDALDGGAGRDWLYGGEGNNTFIVAPGMGLDTVVGASRAQADDTAVFAAGIRPADVSVQLGAPRGIVQPGDVGYDRLVIGVGGNDALVLRTESWEDLGRGALQRFRFDDGTEWTLADLIARADGGRMEWQLRDYDDPTTIVGSQADDFIIDRTGESVTVQARGNDDVVELAAGSDLVSAGMGDDSSYAGQGDDVIAGEAGDDYVDAGEGDDVLVFNHGDGDDALVGGVGLDTLSFGAGIAPGMLSVAFDSGGLLVLRVDGGAGGEITLEGTEVDNLPGDLERIQFVDAQGRTRVFDFAGWLRTNAATLLAGTEETALSFDGTGFELTGTVAPAGGLHAVAYAQTGDLFAAANLADNTPTAGDDVLYGTPTGDALDAGAGNDIVMGLAGDDTVFGGEGRDILHGGEGDDTLEGGAGDDTVRGGWGADRLVAGPGRDELFGDWGGDTYLYQLGQGEVIIDDEHRVLDWGGGEGGIGLTGDDGYGGDYGGGWGGGEGGYGGIIVDDAPNVLSFGPGIRPQDLRYSQHNGDLVIEFADQPGDRVILRGYTPGRATQTRSVDVLRFADGTEIVAGAIDPTGITATASDEGDWLDGTPFTDTLIGGDGDDFLDGRGGADRLAGGVGSDTYIVPVPRGGVPAETVIAETWRPQDVNRLELDGAPDPEDLRLEFDGRDLLLRLNGAGGAIRFAGFDPRAPGMQAPVQEISVPDRGLTMSFDDLLAQGVRIIGTPQSDGLSGTELSDWIEGLEADDTMAGGAGGDVYVVGVGDGTDTIVDSENGEAPNVLTLPAGTTLDDVRLSYDGEGFLVLDIAGSTGNRIRLSGFDPADPLGSRAVERFRFGPNGDEIGYEQLLARGFDIVGTADGDSLRGTALADRIRGGDGNDLIEATPGGDRLSGEGGNDTYVVNVGDGTITIDDTATPAAGNVLRFGPDIDPNMLRNNLRFEPDGNGGHVLLVPYGGTGDVVRLTGFDPQDALGGHAIERFEFDEGTAVDYAALVSWTFAVEGDNSGNALTGTNVADRLYGYDADDVLEADAGEDVLTGGRGSDLLRGGAGRDSYVANIGDGEDVIDDVVEAGIGNVLVFGEGIVRDDVRVESDGQDLLIRYGASGDAVRVRNHAASGNATVIDTLEFAGTAVPLREFMNRAPAVAQPVPDQVALEDAAFQLTLPQGLFVDSDGDEVLSRVTVSGHAQLPQWLQYDAVTRTLFGTPGNGDVGEFDVIVQGMDSLGASVLHSFRVTVQNTNDAPEAATAVADQQATEDVPFVFTVPADAFRDVDAGDAPTLSATRPDGSALPAWLGFDAAARTFSGTPANGDVGSLAVKLVATDPSGAQASQSFAIGVANVNDAPQAGAPLADQAARTGEPAAWQLPSEAFFDVDAGDQLTYSATLADGTALPDWLAFDAAATRFSGTPTAPGRIAIRVTATDLAGARTSQTFTVDIAPLSGAPVTAPDAADVIEDRKLLAWGNVLTNDRDPEGSHLFVADGGIRRGEYGWLTLLPTGGYTYVLDDLAPKVQGLGAGESVVDRFGYLASDGAQRSSGELAVTVQGTNDAPLLAHRLPNVQLAKGKAFSWRMPSGSFADLDRNDTLAYAATLSNGKPLPSWLAFDAATLAFSGTAPANVLWPIDVRIVASDGRGESSTASDVFRISFGSTTVVPTAEQREGSAGGTQDMLLSKIAFNPNDTTEAAPEQANPRVEAGEDDALTRFLASFESSANSAQPALPVLDANWLAAGSAASTGLQEDAAPAHGVPADAIEQHWQQLMQALSRLDAERQAAPGWLGSGQGADVSGLAGLLTSHSATLRVGQDTVGLVASGTQLKGFAGLAEGVSKLTY